MIGGGGGSGRRRRWGSGRGRVIGAATGGSLFRSCEANGSRIDWAMCSATLCGIVVEVGLGFLVFGDALFVFRDLAEPS